MSNLKMFFITCIVFVIILIIYEFRYYIKWFLEVANVTFKNRKSIKDIQKEGMNQRNLNNDDLIKYIELSKKSLDKLNRHYGNEFILNDELERHLRYSRFSEKYVFELLNEILKYMNLNINDINLKINYISSKKHILYAGLYNEKTDNITKRDIELNIQNDMTMNTIISTLAHECTHHLLLSNNIRLSDRIKNECLTDVTAVLLGFGKFMVEGYKISNKIIYDEINHRSIKKERVGYLSYKDIKYVMKNMKKIKV